FTPDSEKTYIDTLFIANNSPVSPYKVPLYGKTDTLTTPDPGSLKSIKADFINGFNTFTISALSPMDCGVMSMWIYVKSSKIIGVNSKLPGLASNIVKDTSVVLSWQSIDWKTPVHFDANEPIITVTLAEKTGQGSNIRVDYEFADIQGTILNVNISISNTIPTSVSGNGNIPLKFALLQNYPNPFNPSTTIQYGIQARSMVRLVIYNVLGQVISELVKAEQSTGWKQVVWNVNAASGLYFYRLEAASLDNPRKQFVETKKMLLLR
ncbi:MAG: T9SS type A sorting domain-containing protein, partial [Ignavibacteria bacterium]